MKIAFNLILLFSLFFLLVYKSNDPSVYVWYYFNFYRCYGNKMAAKIGGKWEIDHFGANLRRLTEKFT